MGFGIQKSTVPGHMEYHVALMYESVPLLVLLQCIATQPAVMEHQLDDILHEVLGLLAVRADAHGVEHLTNMYCYKLMCCCIVMCVVKGIALDQFVLLCIAGLVDLVHSMDGHFAMGGMVVHGVGPVLLN